MNKNKEEIIKENQNIIVNSSSSFIKYLETNFDKVVNITRYEDNVIISTHNIVGVLKKNNIVYRIFPKIDQVFKVFTMIEKISMSNYVFKKKVKYIFFDPKITINIDQGSSLINELIDVFINEVEKVRNIGYSKTYNRVVENSTFFRGKMIIRKQISTNIIPKKFYVRFNQLEYCTIENLILYNTLEKLSLNMKLKRSQNDRILFLKYELNFLLRSYTTIPNNMNLLNDYKVNRINSHYEDLLNICNMFLNSNFYSTINTGPSKFCNFLIRTDVVYERYIFILIKNIIDKEYSDYFIEEQVELNFIKRFLIEDNNEVEKGYFQMIPDIVISKKDSKMPRLVIDTKYIDISNKNKLSNTAYYQLMTYVISLYHQNNMKEPIDGILLAHGKQGNSYKLKYDKFRNLKFYTEAINLFNKEEEITEELRIILMKRLNEKKYNDVIKTEDCAVSEQIHIYNDPIVGNATSKVAEENYSIKYMDSE